MRVTAVDQDRNLFTIDQMVSLDLQEKILNTPWIELEYIKQPGQELWPRRRIVDQQLPWLAQWTEEISSQWSALEQALGIKLESYTGTAFWLDEPGFVCPIHSDGEMPGSLHLNWIGSAELATAFYHNRNGDGVRFSQEFKSNAGYAMINLPDDQDYRILQWHGMMNPVPAHSFRLTSYIWLFPSK